MDTCFYPRSLLLSVLALGILFAYSADTVFAVAFENNVHVVFLTDCTHYSDWQTLGMVFSWRESGQPGPLTKVMCCSEKEASNYPNDMLRVVKTHVAPSFTVHPRTGDTYAAYNKPEAVVDWLEHVTPDEEWIVVLDSDMLLRRPFITSDFKRLAKGWAVSSDYNYMIGVNNELADRHIPEIERRNDTLAGPEGRRSDQVGGFFLIHRDDLKRMSKLWLKYTEDVRADPEAYHLTGDAYAKKPGDKPWISEMYGYSFGAAKAGVWHTWDAESMLYPGYMANGVPRVLHYGLDYRVEHKQGTWEWDKHWFESFDVHTCPPWNLDADKLQDGLFPQPPGPGGLRDNLSREERYRDLIAISVVHTLNAALCEFHINTCPPSEQLKSTCDKVNAAYQATKQAVRELDAEMSCRDKLPDRCPEWAASGECQSNAGYMRDNCFKSCTNCTALVFPPARDQSAVGDTTATGHMAAHVMQQTQEKAQLSPPQQSATPPPSQQGSTSAVGEYKADAPSVRPAPGDAEVMHKLYEHSSLSYKELVYRCYMMDGLGMTEVSNCIKAASMSLWYVPPGTAEHTASRQLQEASLKAIKHAANGVEAIHPATHSQKDGVISAVVRKVVLFWLCGALAAAVVIILMSPQQRRRRHIRSGYSKLNGNSGQLLSV